VAYLECTRTTARIEFKVANRVARSRTGISSPYVAHARFAYDMYITRHGVSFRMRTVDLPRYDLAALSLTTAELIIGVSASE